MKKETQNIISWLGKNTYRYDLNKTMNGKTIIYVKLEGKERDSKFKAYVKRYSSLFNIRFTSNYDYLEVVEK